MCLLMIATISSTGHCVFLARFTKGLVMTVSRIIHTVYYNIIFPLLTVMIFYSSWVATRHWCVLSRAWALSEFYGR